jgi:hypothetical protein
VKLDFLPDFKDPWHKGFKVPYCGRAMHHYSSKGTLEGILYIIQKTQSCLLGFSVLPANSASHLLFCDLAGFQWLFCATYLLWMLENRPSRLSSVRCPYTRLALTGLLGRSGPQGPSNTMALYLANHQSEWSSATHGSNLFLCCNPILKMQSWSW